MLKVACLFVGIWPCVCACYCEYKFGLHLLWLWNARESCPGLLLIWYSHLLGGLTDDSWSEVSAVSSIYSFSLVLYFFPSSSISGACSWNGLFLWPLLEGDPRKSRVVVVAAKLTSSASSYPLFIYTPFLLGRHIHFLTQAYRNQASSTTLIFLSFILHPTPPLTRSLTGACYPSLICIPIKATHPSLHIHTTHTYPSCYS